VVYVVLFAMVAGFLAFRLYAVLGKRTGHEQPLPKPADERVVTLPPARPVDTVPEVRESVVRTIETGAETGLRAVISGDPSFDVTRFLDGYYDQDAYLLCPPHFLPNLGDSWFLDRYRANKWVLVTGEADICRPATEQAAWALAAKSVPHSLHVWGNGSHHDWPEWRKMAAVYLP